MTRLRSLLAVTTMVVGCTDDGMRGHLSDAPVVVDGGSTDTPGATDGAIDGAVVNAFPMPIHIDPGGGISPVYAVDPTTMRALVYSRVKFDDEAVDNGLRDLGIVGGGMPSDRIEGGAAPTSAVYGDNHHLRASMTLAFDPVTGAQLFNNQPFVYDDVDHSFTRWLGSPTNWGGNAPTLSPDGMHVVYNLFAIPTGTAFDKNFSYAMNLANLAETPGRSLKPLGFSSATVLSRDGRMVVFHTVDALVPADTDGGLVDVYALDTNTMTYYLISDGAVDPVVPPTIGEATGAGYRIAYSQPPPNASAPNAKGSIIACQLLTQTAPGCRVAGLDVVDCPSGFCVASVSVAPHGKWLGFGTLQPIDTARDAGGLSDIYRIDLDALFGGGTPAPLMLTPTPPDYVSPVSIRFDARYPQMNDDGSTFFLDTFDFSGLGLWLSPAY